MPQARQHSHARTGRRRGSLRPRAEAAPPPVAASRRTLLATAAAAAASAPAVARPPAWGGALWVAAAADECILQRAPSGLEWCDLSVGDGPLPLRGAFTK
jgi:hypothetical protein